MSQPPMKVPLVNIAAQHAPIKDELLAAIAGVIDHGGFVLGPEVGEFERRFADLCGARYAVGVNSGTDALILALRALGIGPGDEVITATNSFVASASCIALVGAKPRLVDVGPDYNLDPDLLEQAITERTRAIIPVHLTGRPARMDAIVAVAKAHGLHVIEDAAQAVCAEFNGQRVGSLGDVGCFSLHPLKTLSALGDGGVLTTNDAGLYEQFLEMRNLGLRGRDECVLWSGNSRLDSLQAAALMVKLPYLEEWTNQRRANAQLYRELLAELPEVECPTERNNERSVYQVFKIQADRRDALQAALAAAGVGSAVHYNVPIHRMQVAKELGNEPGLFPVAERQAQRILSIPIHHAIGRPEVDYVADAIRTFYARERS